MNAITETGRPLRVVLEGLPGAGKTSHLDELARRFGAPAIAEFPWLPAEDLQRLRLRAPFYRINDEVKEVLARHVAGPCVILDRHYIGTLAFAYALDAVEHLHRPGETYAEEFAWYMASRAAGALTPADLVVMFTIEPAVSCARQPRAGRFDPVFADAAALAAMQDYYRLFTSVVEPHVAVAWIDAAQPVAKVSDALVGAVAAALDARSVPLRQDASDQPSS